MIGISMLFIRESRNTWESTFYEVKVSRYDGTVSLVTD